VESEIAARDQQKVIDLQESQLEKLKEEVKTYQTMMEVRQHHGNERIASMLEHFAVLGN